MVSSTLLYECSIVENLVCCMYVLLQSTCLGFPKISRSAKYLDWQFQNAWVEYTPGVHFSLKTKKVHKISMIEIQVTICICEKQTFLYSHEHKYANILFNNNEPLSYVKYKKPNIH